MYARKAASGRLVSSGRLAQRTAPRGLRAHLRDSAKQKNRLHSGPIGQPGFPYDPNAPRINTPAFPSTGVQRELVILAAYANTNATTSPSAWTGRFFGATGSLKHYFQEVSYGNLSFSPAVENHGAYADGIVGWLKINTYNGPVGYQWAGVGNQVIAAIKAAAPFVNFAQYDTSPRNGRIEPNELHITIIAAGDEQASCGGNAVWAHKYSLGSSAPVLNGVSVGYHGYTIFGEIQCTAGRHQATMGIIAHELGHDLGMPDLYDTDKSAADGGGVGKWSLMASGSWNAAPGGLQGSSPAHLDGFLKSYMGWTVPEQVSGPVNGTTLTQAETSPRAVRVRANPNGVDWRFGANSGSGEYFLLENRQKTLYDAGLPGCGVLVWHVAEQAPRRDSERQRERHPSARPRGRRQQRQPERGWRPLALDERVQRQLGAGRSPVLGRPLGGARAGGVDGLRLDDDRQHRRRVCAFGCSE